MTGSQLNKYTFPILVVLLGIVVLLPWWRNQGYLRDLFDYGLVIASNGHLDRGEKPYVDYTTPIQAGFLGINWLIEKAGGGSYAALTRGAAALILASGLLLPFMLVRRWPWWAACAVGASVTAASASQHTILWHNALGVFTLALVTWSTAIAPVWRRSDWPWHFLAGAGLCLGGLNKLNFQLVAVAAAVAWALRAGLLRKAAWPRVAVTAVAVLVLGLVLPIVAEMAWTGASFTLWKHNVVELAAGSRWDLLQRIPTIDFLFRPLHDYYGEQALPQSGLAGLLLSLVTLAACWRYGQAGQEPHWDRILLPLAVGVAVAAAAALLATNFEIACLGVAAWTVLLTSLWLGFSPTVRPRLLFAGFVLPVLVFGAAGWWSAWLGQRSQFGFSLAPRSEFQPVAAVAPAYASLEGLQLPPDVVLSFEALSHVLAGGKDKGPRPVFYGPGLELLDRYFPSRRMKRQALWGHWGTTYDGAAVTSLRDAMLQNENYRTVFTNIAFAHWPDEVRAVLDQYFVRDLIGPIAARWRHRDDAAANLADSFDFIDRLGGNVDGRMLHLDRHPLRVWRTLDGMAILGTDQPAGQVLLRAPAYRLSGTAVVSRLPGSGDGPQTADFKVIVHGASPEDVRWSARVELPAGQQSVYIPFQADAGGRMLMFWVNRPSESSDGDLVAGFRDLQISHAVDSAVAPRLSQNSPSDVILTPGHVESLFGDVAWRPSQIVVRNGGPAPTGLELFPGGEVWLRSGGMSGELTGQVSCPAGEGRPPVVRIVWYKGARLQIIHQEWAKREQPFGFRVWTAEPGGWIGILVDGGKDLAPVQVRVTGTTLQP